MCYHVPLVPDYGVLPRSFRIEYRECSPSVLLAPAVTVGETERAMDSPSVFFLPLLLPITLQENKLG